MPISLRMLENRMKRCTDKIKDLKEQAFAAGAEELGELRIDAAAYLNGLADAKEEEIDQFLSLFDQLPTVLELARQVSEEEKRRRKYEVRIDKLNKQQEIKIKQLIKKQQKSKKKKAKRLQQMRAAPALEGSQEMEI